MNRLDNETQIRDYDKATDLAAVKRIWREVGWIADDSGDAQVERFFDAGHAIVATIDGEAECGAHVAEGRMWLGDTALPLCAVTAITTSRIARGHAFARRLTAQQIAWGHAQGAAVAALGMFDQGFYDQVGFGTGAYDHAFTFDPGTLQVDHRVPTPKRLRHDDYPAMHAALCGRHKVNGSVVLESAELYRAELAFAEHAFGLGYYEGDALTHFLWMEAKGEHGPYKVLFYAYQNTRQLVELLGLLKSLADQVYSVRLIEPPEVQLQSLLARPFRNSSVSERGKHAHEHGSLAWWQARMLDVPRCVAAYPGRPGELTFQLNLADPVEDLLPADSAWRGCGGSYVVALGAQCRAEPGAQDGLPALNCTVNTFTRLLWGVASASSLEITDGLEAAPDLIDALDRALVLRPPRVGWDF